MRTYGETKNCNGCRFWSEMLAKAEGGGGVQAMCLAESGPFKGKYTFGSQKCDSWKSGHRSGGEEIIYYDEYPSFTEELGSIAGPFETRELAVERLGFDGEVKCKECGYLVSLNYMEPYATQLRERQLCFTCNHWTNNIGKAARDRNVYIIDGWQYSGNHGERGDGFGGRHFLIETNDGRRIETWNLWCQGDIPERFRDRIPNNARFLDEKQWIKTGDTWCLADVVEASA